MPMYNLLEHSDNYSMELEVHGLTILMVLIMMLQMVNHFSIG